MIKFGDKVKVKKQGFHNGAVGTVVAYSSATQEYTVMLALNVNASFYEGDIKCITKKRK